MITHFLSRYRPRYIRSLIYMLQSCEYNVHDYLEWYWRTKDFSRVERRKTLVKTPKVLILTACAYAIILLLIVLAGITFQSAPIISLATVILAPYILAYGIIIPVWLAELLQKPLKKVC